MRKFAQRPPSPFAQPPASRTRISVRHVAIRVSSYRGGSDHRTPLVARTAGQGLATHCVPTGMLWCLNESRRRSREGWG